MKVNVTFRHMDTDDGLREYVEEKISRLCEKYFHRPQDAVVVFTAEKHRRVAEVTLRVDNTVLNGKEETEDPRSAVDQVLDKLEVQAKKYRGKFKIRKRSGLDSGPAPSADTFESEDSGPEVILDDTFIPKPLSVEDAMLALGPKDQFIVFRDVDTMGISVLYRREDGNYGLIETKG